LKPKNPENEKILEALQSVGYSLGYARSIIYGAKEMKDLRNAKKMEKEPYFISAEIWTYLYKGDKK
jgi:hypothetical protein